MATLKSIYTRIKARKVKKANSKLQFKKKKSPLVLKYTYLRNRRHWPGFPRKQNQPTNKQTDKNKTLNRNFDLSLRDFTPILAAQIKENSN